MALIKPNVYINDALRVELPGFVEKELDADVE